MNELLLSYKQQNYHVRFDRHVQPGVYLIETPYMIDQNLRDRDIDPEDLEEPEVKKYLILKYHCAALFTVKGPGIYFQCILTDKVSLEDFYSLCHQFARYFSLRAFMSAYVFATLEQALRNGINFANRFYPIMGWKN